MGDGSGGHSVTEKEYPIVDTPAIACRWHSTAADAQRSAQAVRVLVDDVLPRDGDVLVQALLPVGLRQVVQLDAGVAELRDRLVTLAAELTL